MLDLNLQVYIIKLALESRKSEAREGFVSISSTFEESGLADFDKHNFLSPGTLGKRQSVLKLQRVVLQIRADERRLLGPDPHRNDEMTELYASLQAWNDPFGIAF